MFFILYRVVLCTLGSLDSEAGHLVTFKTIFKLHPVEFYIYIYREFSNHYFMLKFKR